MNFFSFDLKKISFLILLFIVPLLLTQFSSEENSGEISWYLRPFTFTAGVIQSGYSTFSSGVRGTTAMYLNLIDVKVKNRQLLQENTELRAQLGALTELKLENERLSGLLNFKNTTKMNLVAAKVIGRDLHPDHRSLVINRGSHHGIKKNMAVITTGGVVGYVFQTESFTSQILLLLDSYAVVDAIVQRSRARGLVEGKGDEAVRLRYLNRIDDVKEGDLVVTSGLDNIFPKGFPIGTVTVVSKSRYGMSQDVEISPSVNALILEEIFVVTNAMEENFETEKENNSDPNQIDTSKSELINER